MIGEKDNINIDIIIVMDCTGSMQSWINVAKDTVLESFSDIQKHYPDSVIRLGLVCYRDIGDDEQFIVSPLTENIEYIQKVLKEVKALGGGNDEAEDVAGALEKTIELFVDSNSNTMKNILFVTDAPAHGLRYHNITVGDRFPNGDPNRKEPYDQVKYLASMGVDLTIFRIKSDINMMIEEFHNAFFESRSTFTVLDLVNQNSPSSASSLSSLSCLNGFIDLEDYHETNKTNETNEPNQTNETFRKATYDSIVSSIKRRCKV